MYRKQQRSNVHARFLPPTFHAAPSIFSLRNARSLSTTQLALRVPCVQYLADHNSADCNSVVSCYDAATPLITAVPPTVHPLNLLRRTAWTSSRRGRSLWTTPWGQWEWKRFWGTVPRGETPSRCVPSVAFLFAGCRLQQVFVRRSLCLCLESMYSSATVGSLMRRKPWPSGMWLFWRRA